ncbi:MAG: hypothetical protein PHW60_12955 [Kiritimatiellae bacterium]|nr:hypothetical protein [Kiritimatiellia bacterium]
MKTALYRLLAAIVLMVPLISFAADEGTSTNMIDELRQLRLRTEALEQKVSETKLTAPAMTLGRAGSAYMNASFDVLFNAGWSSPADTKEIQPGCHDPSQRGFSIRNAELALDGAVDPYLKGFANIVFMTDFEEETQLELEEAYALSSCLPYGLQAKAGRFYAEFGRQNNQHPHTWAFVDQPLILNRMFGEDGLRQNGARLSWLVPTPNYTELTLGMFNGQGGDAFSFRYTGEADTNGIDRVYGHATTARNLDGLGDFLFVPRLASSFDLTDSQTLVLGASAALGPNDTGADTRSLIYGLDAFWKWKPLNAEAGWPFVTWQTEVLGRNFEAGEDSAAGLPAETLHDWGFYSQVQWGFIRRWVLGLRGEYVTGDKSASEDATAERPTEERISPNITWYPTEFSKLRFQYNHTWQENAQDGDAVWLQLEFMLGAHAAHKF